ncbi:FKBP-type peptidyl-prolyl cis-trans isomerase [Simkania negevensis]|uniref:Peptidyl-prolyl cis-trans isomerase n=1 Tax=Simkania negevensis TaxID=83561 RepID=A0ABS3AR68_9BACT|nr:FKBP-type peptidyl-prolyl cis-trans isomerase [Simkania negevensis]
MFIKTLRIACVAAGCLATTLSFAASKEKEVLPCDASKSSKDISQAEIKKISEAFGHLLGRNLSTPAFSFDLESMIKGIRNAVSGKEPPMSDEEYGYALATIQESVLDEVAQTNLKEAEKFLATNALRTNVVELEPKKLQYEVVSPGSSDAAVPPEGTPLVHYTGKYIDGTVFGTSRTGEPIPLSLSHTIIGFRKGLEGMKEGEKRMLYVHPDLGYGTSGPLSPNSLLVFDIEVVKADANGADTNMQDIVSEKMLPSSNVAQTILPDEYTRVR